MDLKQPGIWQKNMMKNNQLFFPFRNFDIKAIYIKYGFRSLQKTLNFKMIDLENGAQSLEKTWK